MGKTYRKDPSRGKNKGYDNDVYFDSETRKRRPKSCRNNGTCDWCKGNRTHSTVKWLNDNFKEEDYV